MMSAAYVPNSLKIDRLDYVQKNYRRLRYGLSYLLVVIVLLAEQMPRCCDDISFSPIL